MRICVVAGGTGGHVLPGLWTARELRSRGHRIHFVIRTDAPSQEMLAREGFASSAFAYGGFPRTMSLRLPAFPFLSLAAYFNARRILTREAPDGVLAMGGYISVPVGLAAHRLGIPLVLHEQNRKAGLANRFLSRWASALAVSFPETEGLRGKAAPEITGYPLRPPLDNADPGLARKSLGLDPDALTVFIFGGSQGAKSLNRLALGALAGDGGPRGEIQFIHLAGAADAARVEEGYRRAGRKAFVKPFWGDMETLYAAADFVVGRAGAGTVMELARTGLKALLVPFPHATDAHQESNARFLEARGQARVVLEKDLTEEGFRSILKGLPEVSLLRQENRQRKSTVAPEISQGVFRLADLVEKVFTMKRSSP